MGERRNEKKDRVLGAEQADHESYGLVGISRVNGHFRLFGSPIEPMHAIVLRISRGECIHGLGSNRFFDRGQLIEIAMSEVQFAEMITTPNRGSGVPCTITCIREDGKLRRLEDPPRQQSEASKTRDEFMEEVDKKIGAIKKAQADVDRLLESSGLSGKKRSEISDVLHGMFRLFTDSAPFMMKRFEENAERVIAHAKVEISAHAALVAQQTGVQVLKAASEDVPLLVDATVKKEETA